MGIYGAQRAFFDPFARKFNFGATHFFKPYPFTSKFQSVSSASRGRPSFPALAPSLYYLQPAGQEHRGSQRMECQRVI